MEKNIPLFVGLGTSKEKDSFRAAREAALLARAAIKKDYIDLVIVFCSIDYKPENVVKGIKQIVPEAKIIGCSGTSIIMPTEIGKYSIAVLAIKSGDIKFGLSFASNLNEKDIRIAGQELAKMSMHNLPSAKRDIFLMLSDGLIKNPSELINGVQDILGRSFPLIGGAASDDLKFTRTCQYYQNKIFTNAAVGVLLGSINNFGLGIKHGWKPLGKPHKITFCKGNVINKINGKPAINMYIDYFGQEAQELYKIKLSRIAVLYPIGINIPGEDEFIIRNVLQAREDGSLVCQGDIPADSQINLMIGSKDFCIQAAKDAALEAKKELKNKPASLIIIFDSITRSKLLGRNSFEEIRSVREILGMSAPIIGFYTYGEAAPLKALNYRGKSYFHNATIAILAIA